MTTGRQRIIASLSLKVADRMFESWRNKQGDPMTESDLYQFCQETGAEYAPKIPTVTDIIDMIEEFAYNRINVGKGHTVWADPFVKKYYDKATDKAIKLLAMAIDREAVERCRQMIDRYDVKKLVEEHKAQEEQKPVNENIGKRVFVEATYDPATSKSHPETFGTIESVDDTGYLFQVRRDNDNSLSWHDSRTIKVLPHATETQAKGGLLAKYERKQAGGILDIASAAMYEYDEYKKSVIALINSYINRQESEVRPDRSAKTRMFYVGRSQVLQDLLKDIKALVEENDQS